MVLSLPPPYAIIFMADREKRISEGIELQPRIWWRYIDDIFFIWEHGEYSLKQFIETLNACHRTIKFTAEWSKEEVNFLDINIRLRNKQFETDLHINQVTLISFSTQHLGMLCFMWHIVWRFNISHLSILKIVVHDSCYIQVILTF